MRPIWRVVCMYMCICVSHIYFHRTCIHIHTYPHTQALSHKGKILVTLGNQSCLLPLRHISCNLQWLRPIFENYHEFWQAQVFERTTGEKARTVQNVFKDIRQIAYKTNHALQHEVYKAFKFKIYSCKFLILPAVLVILFSYNIPFWRHSSLHVLSYSV